MSLQTRLAALITAIGGDVKAINTKLNLASSARTSDLSLVGNGTENIVHQVTIPAATLVVGSVIRATMYIEASGGVTALTPKLRLGTGGTTADTQVGNSTSPATITPILNHGVRVEFVLTVRSATAVCCNMSAFAGNSAVVAGQQVNLATDVSISNISNALIVSADLQQATATAIVKQCVIEVLP